MLLGRFDCLGNFHFTFFDTFLFFDILYEKLVYGLISVIWDFFIEIVIVYVILCWCESKSKRKFVYMYMIVKNTLGTFEDIKFSNNHKQTDDENNSNQ